MAEANWRTSEIGDPRETSWGEAPRLDAAGVTALYEEHWLDVFRYLRSRGLPEENAADLTADSFERVLRARPL